MKLIRAYINKKDKFELVVFELFQKKPFPKLQDVKDKNKIFS
jgi:hypothetical protein